MILTSIDDFANSDSNCSTDVYCIHTKKKLSVSDFRTRDTTTFQSEYSDTALLFVVSARVSVLGWLLQYHYFS